MAINIKFDLSGNPELPTIILANRNGNKLGQLKVNADSVDLIDKFNDASELSFTVNKYTDGKLTPLWDKIVDFKLVYCKEWDMWFEIKVELDEETESIKTVFCVQLGQAELSQINLYNIHINDEEDIARDDYKISILWDKDNPKASILDRMLEKAPHYEIIHVDDTIKNVQRTFSFDGASIYDSFQEVAEEIGCLFVFPSNSGEGGKIQRTISVYDLQQSCNSCGHRGEFTDKCPKCESTNIKYGYGKDTLIFVTSDELASEGIQLTSDTDSVKNCFKLEAGDDLLTATVRNCNPNGSDYIWRFSDMTKEDMSKELSDKISDYDSVYREYYNDYESKLNTTLVNKYNALVTKYSVYKNDLQSISSPIKGYSNLMNAYYNTVDLALYLESGLMPSVEMSDTTAAKQAALLTKTALSPVAVNTDKPSSISLATANSAVLSMAKIIVRSTYKVEVNTSSISGDKKTWTGNFVVTNYSDEEDTATSSTISVTINNDSETFIKQKIEKALNKEDTDDYSISGLFKKSYSDFCNELKKYALNPLKTFYDACDSCLDILIDQGAGDKTKNPDLYEDLYKPYYDKSSAITKEIKIREDEIAVIEGVWDNADENNPKLKTKGLQQYIEECRNTIQNKLNFEKHLGEDLWTEFCSYRREDTYSNSNYISDGLNNAELFEKALEFIEVAENEIYKSSELQYSISTDLNNLLAIDKFKPLVDSFNLGNWIRVQVNDEIYKLRLIEYAINFGSFKNISVKFSDVTKVKNGITDIESILSQASSMATSYDSTQRQAKQGDNVKGTIDQWVTKGLNSALVRIKSNNNEEVTLGKNGLLCRSYDDITESYSPEQFRLTHNIMAYTTDNWANVKQAIGKHDYIKYNSSSDSWDNLTGYGMTAEFVTAGVVSGSQIIGGDVYSDNYSKVKATGSYLNLRDGTFSFGGGSLRFENGELYIRGDGSDLDISENTSIVQTSSSIELQAQRIDALDTKVTTNITQTADQIELQAQQISNLDNECEKLSSRITINAEQIESEVTRATGAEKKLSSRITQNADGITSLVTKTDGLSTSYSKLEQKVDSFTLEVNNGETSSTIKLKAGSTELSSKEIKLTGVVTFADLSGDGTTTIDGSNIKTGKIDASHISLAGTFDVYSTSKAQAAGGKIGYMQGKDGDGNATDGVAVRNVAGDCYAIVTDEGVRLSAGDYSAFVTRDGAFHVNAPYIIMDNFVKHGISYITPTAENEVTSINVSFNSAFHTTPTVVATPVTQIPGTDGVSGVGVYNITKTGFTLYLKRATVYKTAIQWIAVCSDVDN